MDNRERISVLEKQGTAPSPPYLFSIASVCNCSQLLVKTTDVFPNGTSFGFVGNIEQGWSDPEFPD
jgi:hypothetical protein